jgi:hypothetical protein
MPDLPLSLIYLTDAYRVGETVVPKIEKDWQALLLAENPDRIAFRGQGLVELANRDEIVLMEASVLSENLFEQAVIGILGEYVVFATDTDRLDYQGLKAALRHCQENNIDLLIENDGKKMSDFFFASKLITSPLATEVLKIDPRLSPSILRKWLEQVSNATELSSFGYSN